MSWRGFWLGAGLGLALCAPARAQSNADCLTCHEEKLSVKKFSASVHGSLECTACHQALAGKELPHDVPVDKVDCGACHSDEQAQHARSLHGQAIARKDPLAPRCKDCHGNHDILPVKDPRSAVSPLQVPFVCGRCHREGTPVQRNREIHQDNILENYTESIHGEGLLRKGLIVAANCASCHTAHLILRPSDPDSSIARRNIAATCTKCHAQIENVHRKVIKGELWEKQAHVLPACVDCHQPHKVRRVFYDQGMADADCLRCHGRPDIKGRDGRPLTVEADHLRSSRHARVACSQCHSQVAASHERPCDAITQKVECASCHAEMAAQFQRSVHGQLLAKGDQNAPTCKDCHGTHEVLGKVDSRSATFPNNVPRLCGNCHREGQKAAVRYQGQQHNIVESYTESIHGKGLLRSGLTVTATCTSCHTAHQVLPASDPESSVNRARVAQTCGRCHHGIEELFRKSIHALKVGQTDKPLPECADCHSAHSIRRADDAGFKLDTMNTCGKCHKDVAESYFDTYHGKVSQLGYAKTAKCFDCHGAHDILPVADPSSHLSRENVVATCQKCHAGATRRFAGYLTHATHHDPKKYPLLYWTFWAMTALLAGTFLVSGVHTLLWLPRAFQMRRELKAAEEEAAREIEAQQPEGGERA